MSTTYQSPFGCAGSLAVMPHFAEGKAKVLVPVQSLRVIPPAPLPQTLIGSTTQTSSST